MKKGEIMTQEMKDKISKTLKENPNKYWKGKKLSEEHKRKLSESHIGNIPYNKGKKGLVKWTEEAKQRQKERIKNIKVMHHINGDHEDNRPENRILITPREHIMIHQKQGDIPKGCTKHIEWHK